MKQVSKILQFIFHIIMVICDIVIFILMLIFNSSELFILCSAIILTFITATEPAVKSFYIRLFKDAEMVEKESKGNQMKSDEISDETIMKVLNAVGYEEESWIQIVREHLKDTEEGTK